MDRPLLILDLDETLIHSSLLPLAIPHDLRCFHYYVHLRPFVHEFLAAAACSWDLAVWTSSTRDYAEGIVPHLCEDLRLAFLWTRERCTRRYDPESQQHYLIKDLGKVKRAGRDLCRVLMVDDTPRMLERNYGNLVVVREYLGDPTDQELLHLERYLERLADEEDLRRIEKRGWREIR